MKTFSQISFHLTNNQCLFGKKASVHFSIRTVLREDLRRMSSDSKVIQ